MPLIPQPNFGREGFLVRRRQVQGLKVVSQPSRYHHRVGRPANPVGEPERSGRRSTASRRGRPAHRGVPFESSSLFGSPVYSRSKELGSYPGDGAYAAHEACQHTSKHTLPRHDDFSARTNTSRPLTDPPVVTDDAVLCTRPSRHGGVGHDSPSPGVCVSIVTAVAPLSTPATPRKKQRELSRPVAVVGKLGPRHDLGTRDASCGRTTEAAETAHKIAAAGIPAAAMVILCKTWLPRSPLQTTEGSHP